MDTSLCGLRQYKIPLEKYGIYRRKHKQELNYHVCRLLHFDKQRILQIDFDSLLLSPQMTIAEP